MSAKRRSLLIASGKVLNGKGLPAVISVTKVTFGAIHILVKAISVTFVTFRRLSESISFRRMKNMRLDELMPLIIEQMVLLRKKQGMSHEVLATKAGVTRTAVSYIENGKRKPTLLLAMKLAHALGVDFSELLRRAEETYLKR